MPDLRSMKALKAIFDVTVGVLGGIIGAALFLIFWLTHAAVTVARDLWRAFFSAT